MCARPCYHAADVTPTRTCPGHLPESAPMAHDHQIAMLWMRGDLSFLEQLCVQSFLDAGHHVVLYSYAPVGCVPDGVERRDAGEILAEEGFLRHERTGSPALHSDLFRYRMLDRLDRTIWADTDAYCRLPFETPTGHFYGWESNRHINGGVLGLPKGCATLEGLLEFTRDEFAIPVWYKEDYVAELRAKADAGTPVHVGEQTWGAWGPHAITHFLHETGEVRHALPHAALYPYSFKDRRKMLRADVDPADFVTGETRSIHLYGRRMRKRLAEVDHGLPDPDSLMGQMLIRHRIDPIEAPLRDWPNPDPDAPFARLYRAAAQGAHYPCTGFGLARETGHAPAPATTAPITTSDLGSIRVPQPIPPALVAPPAPAATSTPARTEGPTPVPEPGPHATPAATPAPVPGRQVPLDQVLAITTMKNEGPYIVEWVAYHLAVGITHFLVYTNDCDDGTEAILDQLAARGLVTRIDNPYDATTNERPQRAALADAEHQPVYHDCDCHIVMDVDEFIDVHVGEGRLADLFAAAGGPQMLSMTWRFFGCQGVVVFEDQPVTGQFHRAAPPKVRFPHHNWGFKTLVRHPSPYAKIGVHRPLKPQVETIPHWTNGSGRQMPDKYLGEGWRSSADSWGYDLVTLNHYAVRSIDGFLVKRDRGRANHINRDQGVAYWNIFNRNDMEDRAIAPNVRRAEPFRKLLMADPALAALHRASVDWHRARIAALKTDPDFAELHARLMAEPLSHKLDEQEKSSGKMERPQGTAVHTPPVDPAAVLGALAPALAPTHAPAPAPDPDPGPRTSHDPAPTPAPEPGTAATPNIPPPPARVPTGDNVKFEVISKDGLDFPSAEDGSGIVRLRHLLRVGGEDRPVTKNGDQILMGQEAHYAYVSMQNRIAKRFPALTPLPPALQAAPLRHDKITIVSSMRNEGPFILEWIAYHRSIGVTDFLIYTNGCTDPSNEILDRLQAMGVLTRLDNPFNAEKGQKPQRVALNHAVDHPLVTEADWVIITDVDEFINVHVGDGTLHALIHEMHEPNVIALTWKFFGNGGITAYEDRWITEQFTACAPNFIPKPRLGWGFKAMTHRSAPFSKLGVHRPLILDEDRYDEVRWVNGSGRMAPEELIRGNGWRSTKRTLGYDMVTLNHYILRAAESYLVKRERGRINHVDQDQGAHYWLSRNYASERDERIHAHLPRARAEHGRLMADPELARLHEVAVAWHRGRIAHLSADPDYRALFETITDPDQKDAMFMAEKYKGSGDA